jgi:hypothetical protein
LKTQAKHRGYEQDEAKNSAKDIATAAFDFIISKKGKDESKPIVVESKPITIESKPVADQPV